MAEAGIDAAPPDSSRLARQLAQRIATYLHAAAVAEGSRLTERAMAEQLRVSRSPVRAALRLLEAEGVVRRIPQGGYAVHRAIRRPPRPAGDPEETLFLRMADLHLAGQVGTRVSERALCRLLDAPRAAVLRILGRAAEEGWAERLPGRGWALLPVLSTPEALAHSYRLRMAIEPAGLLDPSFRPDEAALRAIRAEIELAAADPNATPAALFALGLRFHETLMRQSGNPLLMEALARVNRVRRLAGYQRNVDRARLIQRCREHVALLDLVLAGNRRQAARRLRRHIAADLRDKFGN
ncbi:GntR family transcriptional regulator [Muricoccus radiodurans]|uniref:GntR family transcriptional regulator n=1 Tax=Muricoccus radiodurans TaxID=2231721 RepID=UPI003CF52182